MRFPALSTAALTLFSLGAFAAAAQAAFELRSAAHAGAAGVSATQAAVAADRDMGGPVNARPSPGRSPAPAPAAKAAAKAAATPAPAPAGTAAGPAPATKQVPAEEATAPTVASSPAPAPAAAPARPLIGHLNFDASDVADVWVDGKRAGRTPLPEYSLTAGPHRIRFDCHREGNSPLQGPTRTVEVVANETLNVDHDCPEEEPSPDTGGSPPEEAAPADNSEPEYETPPPPSE